MIIVILSFEVDQLLGEVVDVGFVWCFVQVYEDVGFDWVLVGYFSNVVEGVVVSFFVVVVIWCFGVFLVYCLGVIVVLLVVC